MANGVDWKRVAGWSALGGAVGLGAWALLRSQQDKSSTRPTQPSKPVDEPAKQPIKEVSYNPQSKSCADDVPFVENQPMVEGFPVNPLQRNQWIVDSVRVGSYDPIDWVPVTVERNGHRGTFYVMADSLTLYGVRVCANAATTQKVADMLGASLLTPTMADMIYQAADVRLPVMSRPITNKTVDMLDQSRRIDRAIQAANVTSSDGSALLVANQGKNWVISPRLVESPDDPYCHLRGASGQTSNLAIPPPKNRSCNYGWHKKGTEENTGTPALSIGDVRYDVVQGPGICHDMCHDDYSQLICLMRNDCTVDGVATNVQTVLTNPDLAWLLSARTGAYPVAALRLPGVSKYEI